MKLRRVHSEPIRRPLRPHSGLLRLFWHNYDQGDFERAATDAGLLSEQLSRGASQPDWDSYGGELAFRRAARDAYERAEQGGLRRNAIRTPWGLSQSSARVAPGIMRYDTAGHGGYHLSPRRQAEVHPALRRDAGWYEEDADWAVVALTFPQYFSPDALQTAEAALKSYYPDEYEAATGRPVQESESSTLRKRAFDRRYASDWVVVSAVGDWHEGVPRGFVGVWATQGGRRGGHAEQRTFLVPEAEYDARGDDFVIDLTRHRPWSE